MSKLHAVLPPDVISLLREKRQVRSVRTPVRLFSTPVFGRPVTSSLRRRGTLIGVRMCPPDIAGGDPASSNVDPLSRKAIANTVKVNSSVLYKWILSI